MWRRFLHALHRQACVAARSLLPRPSARLPPLLQEHHQVPLSRHTIGKSPGPLQLTRHWYITMSLIVDMSSEHQHITRSLSADAPKKQEEPHVNKMQHCNTQAMATVFSLQRGAHDGKMLLTMWAHNTASRDALGVHSRASRESAIVDNAPILETAILAIADNAPILQTAILALVAEVSKE